MVTSSLLGVAHFGYILMKGHNDVNWHSSFFADGLIVTLASRKCCVHLNYNKLGTTLLPSDVTWQLLFFAHGQTLLSCLSLLLAYLRIFWRRYACSSTQRYYMYVHEYMCVYGYVLYMCSYVNIYSI